MNIYGIYDIKEKEQCVRVGTLQEIVNFFSLTARELDRALKKESTVKNKYKIYFLFKEDTEECQKKAS